VIITNQVKFNSLEPIVLDITLIGALDDFFYKVVWCVVSPRVAFGFHADILINFHADIIHDLNEGSGEGRGGTEKEVDLLSIQSTNTYCNLAGRGLNT